jgi:HEAT repeat protein
MTDVDKLVKKIHVAKWQNLDPEVLRELENPATRQELVNAMHTDDYFVRGSIAWALGEVGAPAKSDLLNALHDADWRLRYAAAEILWMLRDTTIVPDLLAALHDSEPLVWEAAAESLGGLGDYAAVGRLIQALNDEDGHVYGAAIEALRDITEDDDIPELHPYLTSENLKLRMAAAYILGAKGGTAAIQGLFDVIRGGFTGDQREIERAMREIVAIGSPAVSYLIDILNGDDRFLRRLAAGMLGEIGDAQAIEPLIEILADEEGEKEEVPEAASWALAQMGADALPALMAALENLSDNSMKRAYCAEALGKIADPNSISSFVKLLDDSNAQVRIEALLALGKLGDNSAVPKIAERLSDNEFGKYERTVSSVAELVLRSYLKTPHARAAVEKWQKEQSSS